MGVSPPAHAKNLELHTPQSSGKQNPMDWVVQFTENIYTYKNKQNKYKLFKRKLALFQHLSKVGCHLLTESTEFKSFESCLIKRKC